MFTDNLKIQRNRQCTSGAHIVESKKCFTMNKFTIHTTINDSSWNNPKPIRKIDYVAFRTQFSKRKYRHIFADIVAVGKAQLEIGIWWLLAGDWDWRGVLLTRTPYVYKRTPCYKVKYFKQINKLIKCVGHVSKGKIVYNFFYNLVHFIVGSVSSTAHIQMVPALSGLACLGWQ